MGRPKGGINQTWSQEEKLRIVKKYLDEGIGSIPLGKRERVEPSLIRTWVCRYLNRGESALENQKKTGNHCEFEIIESLSKKYPVYLLYQEMNVNRS